MKAQFRKIVIGIDFSDASLAGARWVSTHLAPRAELLLVHVVPVPRAPVYLHEHIASTIDQRSALAPRLHTALRGFADLLRSDGVRVGIRTGVPWSALARVAYEVKADLICVGRGQRRQSSGKFGATTAQRLLGVSHVPVLVIPQGIVAQPDRVLASLSGRPGGEQVMPIARTLAAGWGSSLEAIHVIESDVYQASPITGAQSTDPASNGGAPPERERRVGIDAFDQKALQLLASQWLAATLSSSGPAKSNSLVGVGDPGQELITAVQSKPESSVIVMGRVGESGPTRPARGQYRCGSTTRMVLWAAPCPVFVVPTEQGFPQSLHFSTSSPALDGRLPVASESSRRLAVLSASGWHHGGGNDAA